MSLFYNPQKSGPGVSKNEAEMKPFFRFFELFGRKFWYLTQLNALYILMCLPIVTIGPATAALTQVMIKFNLEQPIFVFAEFFSAFKKHFRRTFLLGIVSFMFAAVFIVYALPYYSALAALYPGIESYFLMGMNMVAGAVFISMNSFIFPQIVRLDLSMNAILQNSAKLCLFGFKRNFITVIMFVVTIFVMFMFYPFSLIALPIAPISWLAFLSVFNAYPTIQKYIIVPFYESIGERNPEQPAAVLPPSADESPAIFKDLGGKEAPIDKKKVKTSGKIIK